MSGHFDELETRNADQRADDLARALPEAIRSAASNATGRRDAVVNAHSRVAFVVHRAVSAREQQ